MSGLSEGEIFGMSGIGDSDYLTARQLVAALQARQVSVVELLDRTIGQIEAHDQKINAVVVRDFDRARVVAVDADKALARGERRPLLGLPMTVKEAFNVAGLPTTWGMPGAKHLHASEDAVAISRLRAAGAIVIGKTNVPVMLADWQTFNPVYGVTNNPWDVSKTPGGSSGGAAAALAAGYVSLEMGSDLSNSLRCPAHCCGVFAHKPTHGVVPMRGFVPPGIPSLETSDDIDLGVIGPMARSASDLALALDLVAGPDSVKATAYKLALPTSRHADLRSFRVLVLDQHPLLSTARVVRSAVDQFAENLHRVGTKVGRTSPLLPDLALVGRTFGQLLMALLSADIPQNASEHRGGISHAEWIRLERTRAGVAYQWRQFFREWDVLLCPIAPTPALPHDHRDMNARLIVIDGQEIPYEQQSIWGSIATLAGLPATAMPIARSQDSLPIGIQIIGPYLEDRTTIAFAELAEREFGGFVAPPGFEG
jgi:amidase